MNQTPPMAEVISSSSSSLRDNPFVVKGLPTQNQVGSQARQSSAAHPVNPAIKETGTENPGHPAWSRSGALMNRAAKIASMPESCTKRTGGSPDARPFEGQIL